jgi:MtN3 and saliva related transmembrane protein
MNSDLIGGLAATLTTVSFVPQAVRVIKTNDTAAISLTMYAMFVAGIALWEAYGLMIGSLPVIASNIVTFGLAFLILAQKVRHTLQAKRTRTP